MPDAAPHHPLTNGGIITPMPQQPGSVDATQITCSVCGYDLSGSAVGGVCPECGTPVRQSLRRSSAASGESGTAITCMILGILSIVTGCGLLGPVAIALAAKVRNEIAMGLASPSAETYAKAGVITGWIGLVIMLVQCVFFTLMFTIGFAA